ncbi:MipA/OmpV family protein [Pseudoalteromonas sp. JBTF-M23]|uniref:MipA/OmpV family protein n=1 Tax=Pseudoalteromonas caenipelagi TaxID=2726988 RepID=A0A849VCR1_9GAMM|nr:MipA/OmpV family protein [Pseudoalteromonas caenipelagi]NOU50845.1 MipA/OmpV family protein [Pseudoalteromonas caenipelagi]
MSRVLLLALLYFSLSVPSYASNRLYADNALQPSDEFYYDASLGFGLAFEDSYLVGSDAYQDGVDLFNINISATYESWYLDVDHNQLTGGFIIGYSLVDKYNWGLDLVLTQAQDGFSENGFDLYSSNNIPELKGINERQFDLTAGLRLSKRYNHNSQFSFELLQDISSTHNGWVISVFYSKIIPWRNWEFRSAIGVNLYSDDFTDYYFGITPEEQAANRPVYSPQGAYNVVYEFHAEYPINEDWVFLTGWMSTWFSDEIYHSPIVRQNHQHKAKLGVRYVF